MSTNRNSAFDKLLKRNVPHILERILLYLDYETFLACPGVCRAFSDVLASESFRKKATSVHATEIRVDMTKLRNALQKGDAQEGTRLLSNLHLLEIDINFGTVRNGAPLHNAAKKGHEVIVKLLLGAGADPNKAIEQGTPLQFAVSSYHINVVRLLLDAGADPNKRGEYGHFPPLFLAVLRAKKSKEITMVRMLIDAGADPNVVDTGFTALYSAARDGKSGIVRVLLEAGADPNRANGYDSTPLHMAAKNGKGRVVKQLLGAGADQNVADRDGHTPLYWACRRGHKYVEELLIAASDFCSNLTSDLLTEPDIRLAVK